MGPLTVDVDEWLKHAAGQADGGPIVVHVSVVDGDLVLSIPYPYQHP